MAYVVVGKDIAANRLNVGWDAPESGVLYTMECVVGTHSSINAPLESLRRVEAQPRYRAKAEPATVSASGDGTLRLKVQHPQRAIAPGQICAFYDGGRLLGGGVFQQCSGFGP